MTGWIAIDRGLFEHAFFTREPMSEREAWVWIISRAAWKDTRHKVGAEMVDVPRGSFMTTLREMQMAWLWGSDARVRNFIKRLENEKMIASKVNAKGNARKTQISVCNYETFQSIERAENAKPNAQETQTERTKGTKKQINQKEEDAAQAQPIEIVPPEKPPPKARLPSNWALSDEGWEYARSQKISDEVIKDEAAGFHAYWTDRRDRDATKSDRGWEQCWATRCRSIAPRLRTSGGLAGSTQTFRGGQVASLASIVAQRRIAGRV